MSGAKGLEVRALERPMLSKRSTMGATSPTARPAHTLAHLVESDSNPSVFCTFLLCRCNPADPLIPREGCDIRPPDLYKMVRLDGFSKISGGSMHRTCDGLLILLGHDVRGARESSLVVSEAFARNSPGWIRGRECAADARRLFVSACGTPLGLAVGACPNPR